MKLLKLFTFFLFFTLILSYTNANANSTQNIECNLLIENSVSADIYKYIKNGNYLYILPRDISHLDVYHIPSPSNIEKVSSYFFPFQPEKIRKFFIKDNKLFIILELEDNYAPPFYLYIFDLSNPGNPEVITEFNMGNYRNIGCIRFTGKRLFFCADIKGDGSFDYKGFVIDLKDMKNPKLVKLYEKLKELGVSKRISHYSDDYLHTLGWVTLYVIDIKDLEHPKLVSTVKLPEPKGMDPSGLFEEIYINGYAYLFMDTGYKGEYEIKAVDLRDVENPKILTKSRKIKKADLPFHTTFYLTEEYYGKIGDYIYITQMYDDGIKTSVVDWRDPNHMRGLASFPFPLYLDHFTGNDFKDFKIYKNLAFRLYRDYEGLSNLYIWDISDPSKFLVRIPVDTDKLLAVSDKYVVLSDLRWIDISDINHPKKMDIYLKNFKIKNYQRGFIVGDYLYAIYDKGIDIINIKNIKDPRLISKTRVKLGYKVYEKNIPIKMLKMDNTLFIYARAYDVSNVYKPEPVEINEFFKCKVYDPKTDTYVDGYKDFIVKDNFAYVACEDRIYVYDISDVRNAIFLKEIHTSSHAKEILAVNDKYLFQIDSKKGLLIYDITDPSNPEYITNVENKYNIFKRAIYIATLKNFLYVLYRGSENIKLYVFDVTDLKNPLLLKKIYTRNFKVNRIAFIKDRAYLVKIGKGYPYDSGPIYILDTSNPGNPRLFARSVSEAYSFREFKVRGNYILAKPYILDVSNPDTPARIMYNAYTEMDDKYVYSLEDFLKIYDKEKFLSCAKFKNIHMFYYDTRSTEPPKKQPDNLEDPSTIKSPEKIKITFSDSVINKIKNKLRIPDTLRNKTIEIKVNRTGAKVKPLNNLPVPLVGEKYFGDIPIYRFPYGLFAFEINSIPAGSTVKVTLKLPYPIPENGRLVKFYKKYRAIRELHNVETSLDGKRWKYGIHKGDMYIRFNITDGGEFDEDGQMNSTIVDPVGLALLEDNDNDNCERKEDNDQSSDKKTVYISAGGSGGGCNLSKNNVDITFPLVLLLLLFYRYRKAII